MRPLLVLLTTLLAASQAHADAPPPLDAAGLALTRPDTLPRRLYGWSTWLLGTDDRHVVVTESAHLDRPARYQSFDNKGRPGWSADHACPDFDDFTTIFVVEGPKGQDPRIVCKIGKQIIAVDLATGKEAWRFSDPRPLYITAGAQGRVAVSVANQALAVIDAKDGRELMRLDTRGAVLEAVAPTPDGPFALLVQDTPGRVEETIELAVGEGGALERVPLSGDDPGRKLIAVAIGGPAPKSGAALAPMTPRWAAPFEGYSFEITPTLGAVIGQPRENVRAAWDLADGKLLWERPMRSDELVFFGEDGAAFARPDENGDYVFGAMDPKTLAERWKKPLPPGVKPRVGGLGGGDLGLVTTAGFLLVRYADGAERTAITVPDGRELPNLRSTSRSLIWVTQRDAERWLHLQGLPPL